MAAIQPTNKSEKDKILDYVMETPHNTNRQILSNMIDDLESSGEGKTEVELSVTQNKTYTPDEGEVYNKVTAKVSVLEFIDTAQLKLTNEAITAGVTVSVPRMECTTYSSERVGASFQIKELTTDFLECSFLKGGNGEHLYSTFHIEVNGLPANTKLVIDSSSVIESSTSLQETESGGYYFYRINDNDQIVLGIESTN